MTDIKLRQPNDTGAEIMLHRSISSYSGDGCSAELTPEQVTSFVRRTRNWMDLIGISPRAAALTLGLRGPAAAQVLSALEAE